MPHIFVDVRFRLGQIVGNKLWSSFLFPIPTNFGLNSIYFLANYFVLPKLKWFRSPMTPRFKMLIFSNRNDVWPDYERFTYVLDDWLSEKCKLVCGLQILLSGIFRLENKAFTRWLDANATNPIPNDLG